MPAFELEDSDGRAGVDREGRRGAVEHVGDVRDADPGQLHAIFDRRRSDVRKQDDVARIEQARIDLRFVFEDVESGAV